MNRLLAAALGIAIAASSALAASARPFTQKDLVTLDRVSDPRVSPDGRWVIYDQATLDPSGRAWTHAVMLVSASGTETPVRLALGSAARWAPDGARILFLAPAGGTRQVWSVSTADPKAPPQQVTALPLDVGAYRVSPDGRTLVVSMAVIPGRETVAEIRKVLAGPVAASSGRLYDRLFVRQWDAWRDGARNHLFAIPLGVDGRAAGDPVALTPGFDGDVPARPFTDEGDFAITPDSKAAVFSARLAGRSEAWSIDHDLWRTPLSGASPPHKLPGDTLAWNTAPVFSPDGRLAARRATKRPGFEADRFGVFLSADGAGSSREVAPRWDRSADQVAFAGDGRSLYVRAGDVQNVRLFRLDVTDGAATPLTGDGRAGAFDVAHAAGGDVLVFTQETMASPPQVYAMRPGGAPVRLTHVGEAELRGVEMSSYESFSFAGWNNETVHGWIVKPQGWRPGAKFPVVFLVHGGPQASWTDSWSTRWNPQVFAGWGYGVVLIDFHGSTGYGQAFTDAISGHWGDRPLVDLQKGWAAAQRRAPWIDAARACQGGNSYGGFMTYWIAGAWKAPWKCQFSHDGIFDTRMIAYDTDELWPHEWDTGRVPAWRAPANYQRFNPIDHVADWSTPMLVIHSEKDYRVPLEQGLAAFTALQRKGVESQFLTFPDEAHFVVRPANALMWHDTIEAWLKRWIGGSAEGPGVATTSPCSPTPAC